MSTNISGGSTTLAYSLQYQIGTVRIMIGQVKHVGQVEHVGHVEHMGHVGHVQQVEQVEHVSIRKAYSLKTSISKP